MVRRAVLVVLCGVACTTIDAGERDAQQAENWHQWRGPRASGVAPLGDPPLEWDESTNIKWKVALPGSGASTPIIWNNRIFLLTAIETDRAPENPPVRPPSAGRRGPRALSTRPPTTLYEFVVLCLDRDDGAIIWESTVSEETPHEGHHPSHGYASSSPTTDGEFLYASFGSRGLFCLDFEGNVKWQKDLGDMQTKLAFGEGTSPVLHDDSLIINWDHEGDSFIAQLDARTGDERWRAARDEGTSWATPLVVEHDGVTQVVTNASKRTRSYDLASGDLLWECGGQTSNPIPSPVASEGVVFCMTGFRGFAMHAIPLGLRGEISVNEQLAWSRTDSGPYVASPVLYDDLLYSTKERNGILDCVDPATGEALYSNQRLPESGMIYASLVAAAGKIYVTNRNGTTFVVKHGPSYNLLATNQLDEGIDASPAIVGRQLFLRGQQHLYCMESGD